MVRPIFVSNESVVSTMFYLIEYGTSGPASIDYLHNPELEVAKQDYSDIIDGQVVAWDEKTGNKYHFTPVDEMPDTDSKDFKYHLSWKAQLQLVQENDMEGLRTELIKFLNNYFTRGLLKFARLELHRLNDLTLDQVKGVVYLTLEQ